MLNRDTIRADQSSKAIAWNNEYKQLDRSVKDLLIQYRLNRERLSNGDGDLTPELEEEAALLRNRLLQSMTHDGLHHLHNCRSLIDDVEQSEYDMVEFPPTATIPGDGGEIDHSRDERPQPSNERDGRPSSEHEDRQSFDASANKPLSVDTNNSQAVSGSQSYFSALISSLGF
jgi:hypothetical protein